MKTIKLLTVVLMGVFAILTTSCSKDDDYLRKNSGPVSLLEVSTKSGAEGVTTFALNNICPILDITNPLTADDIEFLFAMREDEKLSKDLYTAFATAYPANIQFANIAAAEANHIAAIERIFGYYEVDFPALGAAGVFANQALQAKYNKLVVTASATDAFAVMAFIEEENIMANKSVGVSAANANISLLLNNMLRASSNHLKAAVRQIGFLGGEYVPSLLDQNTFDEIINSAFTQGNRYGMQNGQGGNTNAQKGGQGMGNKGSVNGMGNCIGTANGGLPGTGGGMGSVGKGYRGGK